MNQRHKTLVGMNRKNFLKTVGVGSITAASGAALLGTLATPASAEEQAAKRRKESDMYLSIRRYKTKSSAEFTRRVQAEFIPLISKTPGFVAYYAIEAGDDVWASVSIFDTQAQAEDSNRVGADWAKNTGLTGGPPEVTAGKVVAHKMR